MPAIFPTDDLLYTWSAHVQLCSLLKMCGLSYIGHLTASSNLITPIESTNLSYLAVLLVSHRKFLKIKNIKKKSLLFISGHLSKRKFHMRAQLTTRWHWYLISILFPGSKLYWHGWCHVREVITVKSSAISTLPMISSPTVMLAGRIIFQNWFTFFWVSITNFLNWVQP